jgi:hypothetical protein
MDQGTRVQLAQLLRAAASQTIAEEVFWYQFEALVNSGGEPAAALAYESATHYWGNFHERNLLLMRVKPSPNQLAQDQDELNLIADALLGDWPVAELKKKLKAI